MIIPNHIKVLQKYEKSSCPHFIKVFITNSGKSPIVSQNDTYLAIQSNMCLTVGQAK